MGIKQKIEYAQIKLSLPAPLAAELRAVKEAVERKGLLFSLEDEISTALRDMRRQLADAGDESEVTADDTKPI